MAPRSAIQPWPRGRGAVRAQGRERGPQGLCRGRVGPCQHLGGWSFGHDASAVAPTAWSHVDEVVCGADGLLVVLYDQHGAAGGHQLAHAGQQPLRVARVQADGGLVQDIERAGQAAAELGGQAQALHLAARQGGGGPVQGQVAQAYGLDKVQPAQQLGVGGLGDARRDAGKAPPLGHQPCLAHRAGQKRRVGFALEPHAPW